MVKVAGAGDKGGSQENPPVHSKGQRHGMPWSPIPVSSPGGVAPPPPTGTKLKGFTENGHMQPTEAAGRVTERYGK